MPALPPSFLVQPTFVIQRMESWPKRLDWKLWDKLSPIPSMKGLDVEQPHTTLRAGWHDDGLIFGVQVLGKAKPCTIYDNSASDSDSVALFLDLRNTKGIHRASRYCQSFRLVPLSAKLAEKPLVVQEPIARAREDAPFREMQCDAISERCDGGYRILAAIPNQNLNGYDPAEVSKVGFFALSHDNELGDEPLTGDLMIPSTVDPSLWSTLDLVG